MKTTLLLSLSLFAFACPAAEMVKDTGKEGGTDLNKNGKLDIYEDATQPIEKRVADLLGQMTIDEKIGQLMQAHRQPDTATRSAERLRAGRVGSFLDGSALIENPAPRNRVQQVAVAESRLGIPLIFGHDSIHGFRTIFPIPLALACAWDPELFEQTQTISARETAAVGINWTFAPMVDLARDARWGRIAEGFGEDPWLGSLYAVACVRGFQGTNMADPDRVVACLKHYVGYGAAEGGRDYNTTEISEYTLRNFYLPQFKAGVEAGAWTVMSAFNLLSGIPASGNRHTLTEILRDQWKFPGFVISDWTAIDELMPHGVAANSAEAARLGLVAGVDMEMVSTNYEMTLKQQLQEGKINEGVIDEAVRRVLRVKFAKGLFEKPYVDEALAKTAFLKPDALALARTAAARSCVLLKNDNAALPVARTARKIALIGPFGDDGGSLLGCWAARGRAGDVVPLAAGIRAKLSPGAALTVVRGCQASEKRKTIHQLDGTIVEVGVVNESDKDDIEKAVSAARDAEVVILALGEPANWSGENASRLSLDLPGRQMELFEAVAAVGKPVIVVMISGRPLTFPRLEEKAAAILEAWNPGVQGGNGVADVLFGDADPAGRLTVSFPRSLGQVPVYYNHYNTGRPTLGKYMDGSRDPLYPFGFGLTYTKFEYGRVELSTSSIYFGEKITAKVRLKNTGPRAGTEVAQLYLHAFSGRAGPRPVRELKGYQKVHLDPGESRDVEFTITEAELRYYDVNGRSLLEPGKFQLWIAKDSASGEPAGFEVMPTQ